MNPTPLKAAKYRGGFLLAVPTPFSIHPFISHSSSWRVTEHSGTIIKNSFSELEIFIVLKISDVDAIVAI